jgi:hypothetical protein
VAAPAFSAIAIRVTSAQRIENYRGRRLPVVLGLAWFAAVRLAELGAYLLDGPERSAGRTLWYVADWAALVMLLVGLLDDRRGGRDRGFRAHLGSLARLRPTTGALKLLVGGGLAIWLAVLLGGGMTRVVASAVLIALATNLVNALDVRPGRALKLSIPILALAWIVLAGEPFAILLATAVGAGVGILAFDLGEAGMLGDAGSNPIGFLTGLGLAAVLPTWGVLLAAGVVVLLQVVAETVTISRVIEAVPPLRWYDRLGRRN